MDYIASQSISFTDIVCLSETADKNHHTLDYIASQEAKKLARSKEQGAVVSQLTIYNFGRHDVSWIIS